MKIQLGIAEDNPNLIKSIVEKIALFDDLEIAWVAENGQEVLGQMTKNQAEVILMDIHMPELDGIATTRRIKQEYPEVKVIMFTVFDASDKLFDSILAGASGYLLKDEKPGRLHEAIREAVDGGAPMSPAIASKALQLIQGSKRTSPEPVDFGLTSRELEIIEEIAAGRNYQQIAEALFISPATVRKHIENIYRKLQVHNKIEAVQKAQRHGYI